MNKNGRFEVHTHTEKSNIRLLDSINKMDRLVDYALELGLNGIAITDHECLSESIDICKKIKQVKEINPDFKIAIGNEIYLTDTREKRQKYYHLILIAKDEIGHSQLRKLSSIAWYNSYMYGKMRRVPTLKKELQKVANENPGHLICTTACLGGELGTETLKLLSGDESAHDRIVNFMLFLKNIFGEDLYVECAPNKFSEEQINANKKYRDIAKAFNLKMVVGTDAHYLKKEDRYVHESFLNSKDGERELADFYRTTYLMSDEEVKEHLLECFEEDFIEEMFLNSLEIHKKIIPYDLHKKQKVKEPNVTIRENKEVNINIVELNKYTTLKSLYYSENKQEKFWVNECLYKLKKLDKFNEVYLSRLDEEAEIIKYIGDDFGTSLFSYFNNLHYYIKYIWETGSIVGPSRGSACCYLSNYLLDITQLDSVEENLPLWRFLNKGNTGSVITTDIDIDVSPLARNAFLSKMKEEVGEINCIAVGAFGTVTTKSAIGIACRGYRSVDYPGGIDTDISQYLSSMIPSERGFLWPLKDIVNGNKEKGRKPATMFLREVEKYPGLLEIMIGIEGLVDKVTRHAAGVVIADNILDYCSIMRTPKGEIISCYSLYPLEDAGLIKYDILVTEASAKITVVIELLQKYNKISKELTLKEAYDSILHPQVIDRKSLELWNKINSNTVIDLFQFSTGVGAEAIKKIQPKDVIELASANAAMRLISDGESPIDRFMRMKNNINDWYDELKRYDLTKEEIEIIEPYYLPYYGCIFLQESLMTILMDEKISSFTLSEANKARKVVAKKQEKEIPALKEKIYNNISRKEFADYIWDTAIKPQLSYAFSLPHCLGYGWIAMQEAFITLKYHPIYWNTSCLNVNASTIDEVEYDEDYESDDNEVIAEDIENDDEVTKKTLNVKYGKIAKAIGEMSKNGVTISPPLINSANKEFEPDEENNRILYSLKALSGVGDKEIVEIIKNRPYTSLNDFLERAKIKKPAVISLIKSGAFDELEQDNRINIMKKYITIISEPKTVLNLRNFKGIMSKGLLPDSLEYQQRLYNFNSYIRLKIFKTELKLLLDDRAQVFLRENYPEFYDTAIIEENGMLSILEKQWKKIYTKEMEAARVWMKKEQKSLLKLYNNILFDETWKKYATGNISKWEMDSMSFYYHPHELSIVDNNRYGIKNFFDLPEQPIVDYTFKRKGMDINMYKIEKIIGTCIDKNGIKKTFTILTPDGAVLDIRLSSDHFAYYNRQISELDETGTKKVREKSWFTRGTKLMILGIRKEDNFIAKKYKKTGGHRICKINSVNENGELLIATERWGAECAPQ